MKYRSKPSEIEAVQWTGRNQQEVVDFMPGPHGIEFRGDHRYGWDLHLMAGAQGAQGWVPVPEGHWIVRQPGDLSDHWPVDPDYFAAKYDPAP